MHYAWTSTSGDFVSRRLRALNFHFELGLVELFVLLAILLLLRRTRSIPPVVPAFLNTVSSALIILAAINSFSVGASDADQTDNLPAAESEQVSSQTTLPDIYYVILDGYGRQDKLREHFGFDNSEFIDWLRSKGFFVANHSRPNFYWTYLSLSSSLNFEYITYLSERLGEKSRNRTIPYRMIKYNNLIKTLRRLGYRIYHLQSTWGATMHNPAADRNIPCSNALFNNEFYRVAVEVTALSAFPHVVSFDLAQCHLNNFAHLAETATEDGPKFIFAHFIPPHHPYLFDSSGNILRNATVSNQFEFQKLLWGDRNAYKEQISFVNKKVREAVEKILQNSSTPPIIVLQSDHGPTLLQETDAVADDTRLANFTAVLSPGAPNLIPDNITPVNIFRLILRHYFGLALEPLPNRHYKSGYHSPFAFEEEFFPTQSGPETLSQASAGNSAGNL